jgi:hypothetical protein
MIKRQSTRATQKNGRQTLEMAALRRGSCSPTTVNYLKERGKQSAREPTTINTTQKWNLTKRLKYKSVYKFGSYVVYMQKNTTNRVWEDQLINPFGSW